MRLYLETFLLNFMGKIEAIQIYNAPHASPTRSAVHEHIRSLAGDYGLRVKELKGGGEEGRARHASGFMSHLAEFQQNVPGLCIPHTTPV